MEQNIAYLSPESHVELQQELENRLKVLRPEITAKISEAKEMGDLSENFAYHEAREQQGLNESRILELQEILRNPVIVQKSEGGLIRLGSTFTVSTGDQEKTFSLVGENEASPMEGKISNVSPLGQAFIGKGVGDKIQITVPSGAITYKVISIL